MSKLVRFGISIENELLSLFDSYNSKKKYKNRSEAVRDLIRDKLADEKIVDPGAFVFGIISFVYDHHKREIQKNLNTVQHDSYKSIQFSTHIHLDHDNCLEIIIVRDKASKIKQLAESIFGFKGVKQGKLTLMASYK
ncbi:MAG: nickel-responsive transcriptional regulator NikR [Ignavibacteria bacterium]|nr:nickel-responsive transcriptional regulator NikR [Ignavibacteria bacterium]